VRTTEHQHVPIHCQHRTPGCGSAAGASPRRNARLPRRSARPAPSSPPASHPLAAPSRSPLSMCTARVFRCQSSMSFSNDDLGSGNCWCLRLTRTARAPPLAREAGAPLRRSRERRPRAEDRSCTKLRAITSTRVTFPRIRGNADARVPRRSRGSQASRQPARESGLRPVPFARASAGAEVRRAGQPRVLAYVLGNWRKRGEDRDIPGPPPRMDRYSSGPYFTGWDTGPPPQVIRFDALPFPEDGPLPIRFPTSYLLRQGWQRHGLISPWHRPGPRRR
jgi:hypothetical protein